MALVGSQGTILSTINFASPRATTTIFVMVDELCCCVLHTIKMY
jgi:hypothetical protein